MATLQKIPGGDNWVLTKVQYTAAEARGLVVEVAFAWLSATAVTLLLAALAISAWNTRKSVNPHLFVRSHVAAYFVSLLWCDLMQAFASMLSVKWLTAGAVTTGSYCTYQGFLKQSADVSMAVWTVMIALHTFLVVFLRWSMRRRSLFVMLGAGWLLVLLIVVIGPAGYIANKGPFYGINGYYCWISTTYGDERVTLDLLWLFMGAGLGFLLYGLVFLNLRGNVTTSGIYFRRDSRIVRMIDEDSVAIARQMLIYPIAFTILIFPNAVVRFVAWSGTAVPDAVSSFADTVFLMCGLVDVLLFLLTRRVLPEHSVIPRGYSLYCWRRKDRDDGLQRSLSARPVIDLNADLEKAEEDAKDDGATLDDCPFKSANSPDESDDDSNEVTIRVQGEVIDRIHLQPGYEGPATPPGLTPQVSRRSPQGPGCMEDVVIDGMRLPDCHGESGFSTSELPPLPPSAYTAYGSPVPGSARFVGSPTRSGATARFADAAVMSARSPHTQTEFTAEQVRSPASSPRHEQQYSIPEPDRGPYFEEEIVRHFDELPAATPLRSAFSSDPRAASPLKSAREIYESRVPTPVQSARDAYTDISMPPVSAAAPSSANPYQVDAAQSSPHVATPEVRTADAGLSQYRCRSPLLSSYRGEPSPTDSTGYTESDSDDEPFPSARSPAYRQYLGTPRSATFPSQQGPPLSAHEVNPPMSARLPAPSSKKWTAKWPRWSRA